MQHTPIPSEEICLSTTQQASGEKLDEISYAQGANNPTSNLVPNQGVNALKLGEHAYAYSGPDVSPKSLVADKPSQVVLDLKLTDFLDFFRTHESSCPAIQMTCPMFGVPLPSISINLNESFEYSANVKVSLRLSEALIQYVLSQQR